MKSAPKLKLPRGGELLPKFLQVFHSKEFLWRITRRCNLTCPHCYADAGKEDASALTNEEAKQIIDKLAASAKIKKEKFCIAWMGGEPLLREGIFDLMAYAKRKGFIQHIGTNGMLIDKETAKRLKENGLSLACVSLDSHKEEVHDKLKGKGVFKKAISAIHNLKKSGVGVMTVFVMTKLNFTEMEEYEEFCVKELGCRTYFSLFHNIGRANNIYNNIVLSVGEIKEVYKKKLERIKRSFKLTKIMELPIMELFDLTPFPYQPQNWLERSIMSWGVGCQGCRFCVGINWDGEVWPCERMPYPLGNLKYQTFEEIEQGERYQKILNRSGKKGKCESCEYVAYCGGGCLAESYGASSGDPFAECNYCWHESKPASIAV